MSHQDYAIVLWNMLCSEYPGKLPKLTNGRQIPEFNFRQSGVVDSLCLVRFILTIEQALDIRFTDEEIDSEEFRTIGGLAGIIERKMK